MPLWPLYIVGAALLLAFIKTCDPARHRSIYRHEKKARHWE